MIDSVSVKNLTGLHKTILNTTINNNNIIETFFGLKYDNSNVYYN